jgi:homoserine O-acetyltransferase
MSPEKSASVGVDHAVRTFVGVRRISRAAALKSGAVLPGFELVIETYGTLNAGHSNAVLVCHALSGSHHVAGCMPTIRTASAGGTTWSVPASRSTRENFSSSAVNNLGGCYGSTGPLSINPETGKRYGADFPMVTVEDWVAAQARLADHLGSIPGRRSSAAASVACRRSNGRCSFPSASGTRW